MFSTTYEAFASGSFALRFRWSMTGVPEAGKP